MDYADNIVLLANTPTQAESLLHSLEQAAGSIGFHVNADKMENMCFNQRRDITTLKGGSLKLVGKFTTSETTHHLQKITSIHDEQKCGQLLIGY